MPVAGGCDSPRLAGCGARALRRRPCVGHRCRWRSLPDFIHTHGFRMPVERLPAQRARPSSSRFRSAERRRSGSHRSGPGCGAAGRDRCRRGRGSPPGSLRNACRPVAGDWTFGGSRRLPRRCPGTRRRRTLPRCTTGGGDPTLEQGVKTFDARAAVLAMWVDAPKGDDCAILHVVVRHTTPTVRPTTSSPHCAQCPGSPHLHHPW